MTLPQDTKIWEVSTLPELSPEGELIYTWRDPAAIRVINAHQDQRQDL